MTAFSKLTRRAADALLAIAALGLIVMTLIVGWQVFGRYVAGQSPSWSEELSLTLMIWYVSFAAAAGVRDGFHIRIVAFENLFEGKTRRAIQLAADAIVALIGLAMLVWSGELVLRTWPHAIPSLGLPRGLAYLGMPIAGALIFLFSIERIAERIAGDDLGDGKDPSWS